MLGALFLTHLRRAFRSPIARFALIGSVIFALHARLSPTPDLIVSRAFMDALGADYQKRTGAPPSDAEEREMIARFVEEEVLQREALALGLDRGDVIIRRRLAQKMELTLRALVHVAEPTDADLAARLAAEPARWSVPSQISFEHVFVARRPHRDLSREAEDILIALRAGAAPDALGDPFLRGRAFLRKTDAEVEATFGPGFARSITSIPPGAWAGPFVSSFGHHLVRVLERAEPRPHTLDEVRPRVREALLNERRDAAYRAEIDRLRAKRRVIIEGRVR